MGKVLEKNSRKKFYEKMVMVYKIKMSKPLRFAQTFEKSIIIVRRWNEIRAGLMVA